MSVTFTWYVRGGSSLLLAVEVRGMGAILPQTDGPPRSTLGFSGGSVMGSTR